MKSRVLAIIAAPALALSAGLVMLSADDSSAAASASWPDRQPDAVPFRGIPAVGALFTVRDGRLHHFCTATVVASPDKDLAITAAHCLQGKRLGRNSDVIFAPGYHDGKFPHGRWIVRAQFVDYYWQRHRDPNFDVAFIVVGRPGQRVQDQTGAERLETSVPMPRHVQVVGYPDDSNAPVTCSAVAHGVYPTGLRQLVFVCGGYTDGTSGGPFLIAMRKSAGDGDIIGVIGGYEQGGDKADVSYSPRFLRRVAALYKRAIS